jgi:hypothetical protein
MRKKDTEKRDERRMNHPEKETHEKKKRKRETDRNR